MYRSTKLNGGRRSTSVVLKKDALLTEGNARGMRKVKTSASAHRPASTAPALKPSVRASSARSFPRLPTMEIIT
jgi:hypothetical protein